MPKFGRPRLFSSLFSIVLLLIRFSTSMPASFGCAPRRISSTITNEQRLNRFASPRPVEPAGPTEPSTYSAARRIAETSGNFPGESARCGDTADLTARVDAVAVDRAVKIFFAQLSFSQHLE